jgi:hypothetical protein
MPQGTPGCILGCVASESLLAKSPGRMPEAVVPQHLCRQLSPMIFAGGVTKVVETQYTRLMTRWVFQVLPSIKQISHLTQSNLPVLTLTLS